MRFLQRPVAKTQCAGQQCSERDDCLRYQKRLEKSHWASFDIEQLGVLGPCIHRVDFIQRKDL